MSVSERMTGECGHSPLCLAQSSQQGQRWPHLERRGRELGLEWCGGSRRPGRRRKSSPQLGGACGSCVAEAALLALSFVSTQTGVHVETSIKDQF